MSDDAATDPHPDDHQAALDDLVRLLDLEVIEVNMFRGVSTDENRQRVFGGQVAGQALVAAARTIEEPGRMVHSLHAYFLRPGDPKTPILYEVDRIRDGRSFTTRRVVAIQHGKAIFNLQASFHNEEPGPDHQVDMPTGLASPDSLPDFRTRMAPYADQIGGLVRPAASNRCPLRQRRPDVAKRESFLDAASLAPRQRRASQRSGAACLHRDLRERHDVARHHGAAIRIGVGTALGCRWRASTTRCGFHRPFRADEWMLYDQVAQSTTSARGLARGSIFTSDGQLAISVVQEGLTRVGRS